MKCIPRTLGGRRVAEAIRVMDKAEVLAAKMQSGPHTVSSFA